HGVFQRERRAGWLGGLGVPEADRAILAGGDDGIAIRAEGNAFYRQVMLKVFADLLAAIDFPNLGRAALHVIARNFQSARNARLAVRAERNPGDVELRRWQSQRGDRFAGGGIPQDRLTVFLV